VPPLERRTAGGVATRVRDRGCIRAARDRACPIAPGAGLGQMETVNEERPPEPIAQSAQNPPSRQAIFNQQPIVLWALIGAIAAAHFLRTSMPGAEGDALGERYSVVPLAYEGGLNADNLLPLFAHTFVHGGLMHLLFNLVLLLAVGASVVRRLDVAGGGWWRFLALFFGCAALSALTYVAFNRGSPIGAVGASGAICGVFAAYLMGARWDWRASLRDSQVLMAGVWFLAINVGAAYVVRQFNIFPIAWEAHLGGFIAGMVLFPLLAPKRAR
jgi:membrane associated rhomboid family serine protease